MAAAFVSAEIRRDFPGLDGIVYLNSAGMGVPPRQALDALSEQIGRLAGGPHGGGWGEFIDAFEAPLVAAHREAARLLGAAADEVGLISDTTSGLHQAIDAIPFRAGDNVVLGDLEYPQVALAATNAVREDGAAIRFVKSRDGRIGIDDYRDAIDGRTRAIVASSVGWVTGQRLDLAGLSQLAEEKDLYLVVDAVQQLGALSIDCSRLRIDFLMGGGYKWLNAPFGVGLLYVRRAAHERGLRVRRVGLLGLEPPAGGWSSWYGRPDMVPLPKMSPAKNATRFESQGTPNRLGAPGLAASLGYRNALPNDRVDQYVLDLGTELIRGLLERGARVWTPRSPAERAGIVAFTFGGGADEDAALREFLERRAIYVSARYCSGIGGVRAAIHFFNTLEDLTALLEGIDDFRRRGAD